MSFLRDEVLVEKLYGEHPILTNCLACEEWGSDDPRWYAKDSMAQASAIDLHIGKIWIPQAAPGQPGSADSPKESRHALYRGQTAMVTTKEEFKLPSTIGGIGFPPFRLSSVGILMPSVGYVDPGYCGPLRLSLINMGRGPYYLNPGEHIAIVLLFELKAPPRADYAKRHEGLTKPLPITQQILDTLSKDFLDVSERAEQIAKKVVRKELPTLRSLAYIGFIAPVGVLALGLLAAYLSNLMNASTVVEKADLEAVTRNIEVLNNSISDRVSDIAAQVQHGIATQDVQEQRLDHTNAEVQTIRSDMTQRIADITRRLDQLATHGASENTQ